MALPHHTAHGQTLGYTWSWQDTHARALTHTHTHTHTLNHPPTHSYIMHEQQLHCHLMPIGQRLDLHLHHSSRAPEMVPCIRWQSVLQRFKTVQSVCNNSFLCPVGRAIELQRRVCVCVSVCVRVSP